MLTEIVGTFVGRWYVTLFGITFVVLCVRHLGWKRTAIYSVVAIGVGVLAENGSVHLGIPYTRYAFNPDLRGKELWVFDAPLMVSLSYTFMSYFGFATARLIMGGPFRSRGRRPVLEVVLAVVLTTWGLWIVDPISRLGAHFFLGELFRYDGPGFWFGLPLGSQLGFMGTSAVLVGTLAWLARDEVEERVDRWWRHPRLPALGGYLGQPAFMAATAFVVARTNSDPAVVKLADTLAGGALVLYIPLIVIVAVTWAEQLTSRSAVDEYAPTEPSTADTRRHRAEDRRSIVDDPIRVGHDA